MYETGYDKTRNKVVLDQMRDAIVDPPLPDQTKLIALLKDAQKKLEIHNGLSWWRRWLDSHETAADYRSALLQAALEEIKVGPLRDEYKKEVYG